MTGIEFDQLWNEHFAPLTNAAIPNFHEHLVSERMLEDYLDIFRGHNTREGNIQMPYPHPFFDADGNPRLPEIPCIKYILIGEARPPLNPPIYNDCGGDTANTYFYNIQHVHLTPWLTAPRILWDCPDYLPCPHNKVQTLLCLASKGVLLLDLFPFAIGYNPALRCRLNVRGVTRNFWDNHANPYSVQNRINANHNLLCDDWDLSLVAPCLISVQIVNPIHGFPPIATMPVGLHPAEFRTLAPDHTRCPLGGDWRKVAVSAAGFPTAHLIGISF